MVKSAECSSVCLLYNCRLLSSSECFCRLRLSECVCVCVCVCACVCVCGVCVCVCLRCNGFSSCHEHICDHRLALTCSCHCVHSGEAWRGVPRSEITGCCPKKCSTSPHRPGTGNQEERRTMTTHTLLSRPHPPLHRPQICFLEDHTKQRATKTELHQTILLWYPSICFPFKHYVHAGERYQWVSILALGRGECCKQKTKSLSFESESYLNKQSPRQIGPTQMFMWNTIVLVGWKCWNDAVFIYLFFLENNPSHKELDGFLWNYLICFTEWDCKLACSAKKSMKNTYWRYTCPVFAWTYPLNLLVILYIGLEEEQRQLALILFHGRHDLFESVCIMLGWACGHILCGETY